MASRSKKGIKLITTLRGEEIVSSKVTDVSQLNLPMVWQKQIASIIYNNRMLYEPHIESATNYNELRERLKNRGFENLPMGPNNMLQIQENPPIANTSSCKTQRTMIRKKK